MRLCGICEKASGNKDFCTECEERMVAGRKKVNRILEIKGKKVKS